MCRAGVGYSVPEYAAILTIYLVDYDEGFEFIFSTSLLNISFYFTFLYLRPRNLLNHDYDIYQYYVPTVKNLEIKTKIIVLNKRLKKSDSRRIIRARTINEIIEKKR